MKTTTLLLTRVTASLLRNGEVQAIEVQNANDLGEGSLRQAITPAIPRTCGRGKSNFLTVIGPVLALVLASVLWGTADVAGKLALNFLPPATLAVMRFSVALAIFWPLARKIGAPKAPAKVVAPLGILGVAMVFFLQNFGLTRTAAANASMVQGIAPVLTLVFAALFLGERLGIRRIMAAVAAVAGVSVVALTADGGIQRPGVGDLLVLASTACFATFVVLGRRAFPKYGTLSVLSGMTAWGTAALVPVAAFELCFTRLDSIGFDQFGLVLYLGAGCSALTYALWGYALCHLEAGRAAIFDALIPVVGVATAMLVLREVPLVLHLIGGGLVVGGVLIAVREPKTVSPIPAFQAAPTGISLLFSWIGCWARSAVNGEPCREQLQALAICSAAASEHLAIDG